MFGKALRFGLLLLLWSLSSCRCAESAPSPSSSATSSLKAAHPAPEQAIVRCRAAAEQIDENTSPSDRFVIVAEACAGIFAERGCREAWLAAAKAEPHARMRVVVQGCRVAYCPLLAAPKPELCEERSASTLSPASFMKLWPDFFAAVLERDLGADRAAVGKAMNDLVVPVAPRVIEVPRGPGRDAQPPPLTVHVRCPKECELELRDSGGNKLGSWRVSPDGSGPGMAQMATRAARAAEGRAVTIQAAPDVQYALVIAVMDALRDKGLDHVSFGVDPLPG